MVNTPRTVHIVNEEMWSPKGMGKSKADSMLVIHRVKNKLPKLHKCNHVYTQQDTKKHPQELKSRKRNNNRLQHEEADML